jgi:hypothetical protein
LKKARQESAYQKCMSRKQTDLDHLNPQRYKPQLLKRKWSWMRSTWAVGIKSSTNVSKCCKVVVLSASLNAKRWRPGHTVCMVNAILHSKNEFITGDHSLTRPEIDENF